VSGISRYKNLMSNYSFLGFLLLVTFGFALGVLIYSLLNPFRRHKRQIVVLLTSLIVSRYLVEDGVNQRLILITLLPFMFGVIFFEKSNKGLNVIFAGAWVFFICGGKGSLLPSRFEGESIYSQTWVSRGEIYQYQKLRNGEILLSKNDKVFDQKVNGSIFFTGYQCSAITFALDRAKKLASVVTVVGSENAEIINCLSRYGLLLRVYEPLAYFQEVRERLIPLPGKIRWLNKSEFIKALEGKNSLFVVAPNRLELLEGQQQLALIEKRDDQGLTILLDTQEKWLPLKGFPVEEGMEVIYWGVLQLNPLRAAPNRIVRDMTKIQRDSYYKQYKKLELESL